MDQIKQLVDSNKLLAEALGKNNLDSFARLLDDFGKVHLAASDANMSTRINEALKKFEEGRSQAVNAESINALNQLKNLIEQLAQRPIPAPVVNVDSRHQEILDAINGLVSKIAQSSYQGAS